MLLKVWTESGGRTRVRITRTTGLGSQRSTAYASGTSEALAQVKDWLDELVTAR